MFPTLEIPLLFALICIIFSLAEIRDLNYIERKQHRQIMDLKHLHAISTFSVYNVIIFTIQYLTTLNELKIH